MKKTGTHITIYHNGFDHLDEVCRLNRLVFGEERLINRLDHQPLIFLTAHCEGQLAGFKIGYAFSTKTFYSAKGACSPFFRRQGVASKLLFAMAARAASLGFRYLAYDTFPRSFPGMLVLGLKYGFRIEHVVWSDEFNDFRVRLELPLQSPKK